ncbi:hypothetical protein K0M31_013980, partial [Melipona bicolor]
RRKALKACKLDGGSRLILTTGELFLPTPRVSKIEWRRGGWKGNNFLARPPSSRVIIFGSEMH